VTPRDHERAYTDPSTLAKPGKPIKPQVPTGRGAATDAPESASAARIRAATRMGPDGVPFADRAAVLETMRNPTAVRELKTAPPQVQAAFNNTRNQIYREHDAAVLRELRTRPDMAGKRLAVVDVRTPGSDPNSINTDRDFRVVELHTDPRTGRTEAIEVDRRTWGESSDRAFARATGGPADDPVAARDYARAHQQNATDRYHEEAAPDLARQAYVKDPVTGEFSQHQVRPNIERVAAGETTLHDPQALGKTYETKVVDALPRDYASNPAGAAQSGRLGEAYVQAGKAIDTMSHVREGYARQGYDVGKLPPDLQRGMAIVSEGKANFHDPQAVAALDARLRAASFDGGLPAFAKQVSGQIEALKWAKQQ
jgi:hypothetical protein